MEAAIDRIMQTYALLMNSSAAATESARIKVTVKNEGSGMRSIYRTVDSGGSFGASPGSPSGT